MDREHSRRRADAIDAVAAAIASESADLEPSARAEALATGRRIAAWLSGQSELFWSAHLSDSPESLGALARREDSKRFQTPGAGTPSRAVASGPVADMLGAARRELVRLHCLDDARVDAALAVYDAVADAWAARHHSTRQRWYETHIAAIAIGGSHVGTGLPFDPAARVKGATAFLDSGLAIVYAFEHCDVSTMAHECAHLFRRDLEGDDLLTVELWLGVSGGHWQGGKYVQGFWTEEAEERFARAFERYLLEGEPPTPELEPVFATLKRHLCRLYLTIEGSAVDIEIGPVARRVFAKLLGAGPVRQNRETSVGVEAERPAPDGERTKTAPARVCPSCQLAVETCRCLAVARRAPSLAI